MSLLHPRRSKAVPKGVYLTQEGLGSGRNAPHNFRAPVPSLQRLVMYRPQERPSQLFAVISQREALLHEIAVSDLRHMALLSHCHGLVVT